MTGLTAYVFLKCDLRGEAPDRVLKIQIDGVMKILPLQGSCCCPWAAAKDIR
jgi:hypothetical protein